MLCVIQPSLSTHGAMSDLAVGSLCSPGQMPSRFLGAGKGPVVDVKPSAFPRKRSVEIGPSAGAAFLRTTDRSVGSAPAMETVVKRPIFTAKQRPPSPNSAAKPTTRPPRLPLAQSPSQRVRPAQQLARGDSWLLERERSQQRVSCKRDGAIASARSKSSEQLESDKLARERRDFSPFPSLSPRAAYMQSEGDPFALRRFTSEQRTWHARALEELRKGAKSSCWMWYIMPTPPHIVNGIEKGSSNNKAFSLRSDAEVLAYLRFEADDVNLRSNYVEILEAVKAQLHRGKMPFQRGDIDKLKSNLQLFERVARQAADDELHTLLKDLLRMT